MDRLKMPSRLLCGYFDCSVFSGLSHSPERTRTLFEIEYYLSDGLTTYTDGRAYTIKKSHVLIGKPGQQCNSLLPFQTKFLKFDAEGALAEVLCGLPEYFPCQHTFEIEGLLDTIIAKTNEKNALSSVELAAAFWKLIARLSKDAASVQESRDPTLEAVESAKRYIEKYSGDGIKLSDIAASVSLSPSYFHSLFTSVCGITPHDYLTECRISAARELLCMTSLSISEIAEKSGFGNQQYLGTVFQQKMGISPGRYRKAYRQNYLV